MVRGLAILLLGVCLVGGCTREARTLAPSLPQTRPAGDDDPRIPAYQDNYYQMSQGGRYFSWYGCSGCHTENAKGAANLSDGHWQHGGGFSQVFGSIADRHGRLAYGSRIPIEPLWQLTAYVRDLPQHYPEKRRRVQKDAQAEPQGSTWSGPQ